MQGQLLELGLRVVVEGAGRVREGAHPQTEVVRRCCPNLRVEIVGERGTEGLDGDDVLAVPSCHLVESGFQESEPDSTCYW